ncbi:pyruvate-binding protein [Rhizobacter sp. Root404]|nr:esterase-like activity of phytase family protein [Rhizobacter sp. Root404]KQW37053.1 pyruvate-binding protein [Rhizobacter sp. Root404]
MSLLIASACAAMNARAGVDLIAIGQLGGHGSDLSAATGTPLENGAPGNLLGGLGSGFAYAGCNSFVALPDRGPNAIAYKPAVSDTASYIDRFHGLEMQLAPSATGAALPFTLTPTLAATTLLHSGQPLVYGSGVAAGLPHGAPALNALNHTHYFTGRSDNFDSTRRSTDARDARLDPEGIRASNDGESVYVTDEYGPYVYRFNRKTGRRTAVYALPDAFAVTTPSADGNEEIAVNTSGRVANKGMEGLAISPDGASLFGVMQSPLLQDGATDAPYTRIVKIDLETGATMQFVYPLTNIGTAKKPKYPTVSEIVAINSHEFLVDERDGKGLGDGSTAVYKMLYRIDLAGALDASLVAGAGALAPYAVAKTPFLDIVAALNAHGIASNEIPAKLEGMTFGPEVMMGGVKRHTLFIANDNDFTPTVTDGLHPGGIENPNRFFVFAVDAVDLAGYVPQAFAKKNCR